MTPSSAPAFEIASGNPAEMLDQEFRDLAPLGPNTPLVVFKADLVLSYEQEKRLCDRAMKRYEELCVELGRNETMQTIEGIPAGFLESNRNVLTGRLESENKFLVKRMMYALMAENDFTWRPFLDPNSIFAVSNLVVPLCRRIATQQTARASNYFFGSDPWINIDAIGNSDEALARALQKIAESKLIQNQNQDSIRRSVKPAFDMGEAILKVGYVRHASFFRKRVNCLVGEDGNPFLGADGLPIEQDDEWVAVPTAAPAPEVPAADTPIDVDALPALPPMPDVLPPMVLKRDGLTLKPPVMTFAEVLLDQEIEHYCGPEVKPIYYRDFLAPLTARTLQAKDADCIVHLMNYTANALAADYMESPGESLEELQAAIEAIRNALGQTAEGKTGDSSRSELSESLQPTMAGPAMETGEFMIRFDADGDGYEEDILLVMELTTRTPIFYNYMAAMNETGLRPVFPIVAKPVADRWYGQGTYEYFSSYQETVDLLVNRRNIAQGSSGKVVFWRPNLTEEGEANKNLRMNDLSTWTPKANAKSEDILDVIYLSDTKYDKLTEEIQFFLQLALNESGVQHANDGNAAGMSSTKLATGIRNIEKSAMEMFSGYISELEMCIGSVSNAFVSCLFKNLKDDETVQYMEGKVPAELMVAARDVKNLKFNITVLLTRYKNEQILKGTSEVIMVTEKFYSLQPLLQALMAPLYIKMLTSLQVEDSERFIVPQAFSVPISGPTVAPEGVPGESTSPIPNL